MHKQGSEIYTPLNSSYKSILIFVFQNRGRFSDAKRPEDMDDTFGSNFIHTGIGIERDRLLFSEAQKAEKTKYSGGETRGNNFLNHNIGCSERFSIIISFLRVVYFQHVSACAIIREFFQMARKNNLKIQ